MALFYKLFKVSRIVFSLCLLMIFSAPVWAVGALFTVEGVEADVSASNAIEARTQAFEEAQVQAFETLAQRMLSEQELLTFQKPEGGMLSTLIQDYEVSNEKLSSRRYSATYKFRFKVDEVRQYLSGRGVPYTDVSAAPMLILPFIQTDQGTLLWSDLNAWFQAWSNIPDISSGLVPLILPIGDLMDVKDIGDEEALTYNPRRLQSMLDRYGAREAVIALARPTSANMLEVQIFRTDRQRPEYVHQVLQPIANPDDLSSAYSAALSQVRGALRSAWKEKTIIQNAYNNAGSGNVLRARIRFSSLEEWAKLRRALERVQSVQDMKLDSLSPREALVSISYQGGLDRFTLALEQVDMALELGAGELAQPARGLYGRFGQAGQEASPIYDLVYQRYGRSYNRDYFGRDQSPPVQGGLGGGEAYRAQF